MNSRPNIVWSTLDSVRADHTSFHGYSRDTTPNLERIGDEGTVFENCFAHSVATAASSASIFTGAYPSKHQVAMGEHVGTIPAELQTAAELFSEAGYHTACVTTNPRLQLIGADTGFDEFHDISRSTLLNPSNVRTTMKFLANLWSHSVGATTKALHHSFSLILNDLATRWIDDVTPDDDPFFLYLHYNEPHRPYLPPLPYRDRYTNELDISSPEAIDVVLDLHENAVQYMADGLPLSDDEWDIVTAMYDAEISYTDEMVGRLFQSVQSMAGETAFVVTADHGELLGEKGFYGHRHTVADPLVHVPLVTHGVPGVSGRRSDVVQHADVMKTLLSVAGASTDQFGAAVDLRSESREFAISQERVTGYEAYSDRNESFDTDGRLFGQIDGLRTREFKLVSHDEGVRLYRLPDEQRDVAAEYPDILERLQDELTVWRENYGRPLTKTATEDDYDEATRQRLADLGYLE